MKRFKEELNSLKGQTNHSDNESGANSSMNAAQQLPSVSIVAQQRKIYREALADAVMKKQRNETRKELSKTQKNANARMGVPASENELATYLVARSALNKPIEGRQLAILRSGNQTVNEARGKLNAGRGNVDIDINRPGQKYENESSMRTKIGRDMLKKMLKDSMPVGRKGQIRSSVAELCRAGNCGEHAHVTTHVHANKLTGNQTVHMVSHAKADHAWSELRMKPKGTSSDVIMDAWANGPAVLREDSEFAQHVHKVNSSYSYSRRTGPIANKMVQQQATQLKNDPKVQSNIKEQLRKLKQSGFKYSSDHIWLPTPVISEEFHNNAKDKLTSLDNKNPVFHDILKAGVARNLGANVKQARDFADSGSK